MPALLITREEADRLGVRPKGSIIISKNNTKQQTDIEPEQNKNDEAIAREQKFLLWYQSDQAMRLSKIKEFEKKL